MPRERKQKGSRKLEKRLFIVCEGMADKSESAYFKALIKYYKFAGEKVVVAVKDNRKNTGKELVNEAKRIKEFPHDEVWLVYDMDGYTKHPETFSNAKDSAIKIAFSAISFEYWILLHFENTSRAFMKSIDVIKYMKDKNYIDYSKGSKNIYFETKDKLDYAVRNAKILRKTQFSGNPKGTPIYSLNPYTNIDNLISNILKLQKIS